MVHSLRFLKEVAGSVLVAVVLAALIRLFVLEPFVVPSGSMEPTLMPGDRIIALKLGPWREPRRGDVEVFRWPPDPRRDFVKRAVGLPGEEVAVRGGCLYVDGREVPEPYLRPGTRTADFGPVRVPPNSYFMLGDNRGTSSDSRAWGFVPRSLLVGRAVLIYWPPWRAGLIR